MPDYLASGHYGLGMEKMRYEMHGYLTEISDADVGSYGQMPMPSSGKNIIKNIAFCEINILSTKKSNDVSAFFC
jgi:hypothetical protein